MYYICFMFNLFRDLYQFCLLLGAGDENQLKEVDLDVVPKSECQRSPEHRIICTEANEEFCGVNIIP